jgi:hypothetical protein
LDTGQARHVQDQKVTVTLCGPEPSSQVFADPGRADPARPGSGLAKVVGLGYAGLAAGPAVIGAVASRVGLHRALGIPVLLALWIAVGAAVLAPRRGVRDGGAEARARSG